MPMAILLILNRFVHYDEALQLEYLGPSLSSRQSGRGLWKMACEINKEEEKQRRERKSTALRWTTMKQQRNHSSFAQSRSLDGTEE